MTFLSRKVIVHAATFHSHRPAHIKVYHFGFSQTLKVLKPWCIYLLHYGFGRDDLGRIDPDVDILLLAYHYIVYRPT